MAAPKIIRAKQFAERLTTAADANPTVPPMHKGRLVWIRETLKQQFGVNVSIETVRKWFAGEASPRADKTARLAEILHVDVAWLQIGIDHDVTPRERRSRRAVADGIITALAGFMTMDGGTVSFPEEGDAFAEKNNIDLYAIIRGRNYFLAVCPAIASDDGAGWRFPVPTTYESVVTLAVIRDGLKLRAAAVPIEFITENGKRAGARTDVHMVEDQFAVFEVHSFKEPF